MKEIDKCSNKACTMFLPGFGNRCAMFLEISRCSQHVGNEHPDTEHPLDSESALDTQVAGDHYKGMAIQPIEFTHKNNLNFCQGNIIKYTCRYKNKGGIEDLKKVKHYADLLIELEYEEPENSKEYTGRLNPHMEK